MRVAEAIGRIVDLFYVRPFSQLLSPTMFRYAACGAANMALDLVWYFVIYHYIVAERFIDLGFVVVSPHVASLIVVFPITFFTGFWLNKYVTFTQSSLRGYKQLWRYILIVMVNLLVNYFGLKLCVECFGWYPTPSKMIITLITIAISYFGQKYYSFRVSN